MIKAVIMASGEGTNAENIVSSFKNQEDQVKILGVIADRPKAGVLERATRWGLPKAMIEKTAKKRSTHEEKILSQIREWGADWIFLAGYMRVLTPHFISKFYDPKKGHARILNVHPSLLPSFKGLKAYERAYEANVAISGVSVHFVDEGVDTGQLLVQKKFRRFEKDSFDQFRERGLRLEHQAYIEAISKVAKGDYL